LEPASELLRALISHPQGSLDRVGTMPQRELYRYLVGSHRARAVSRRADVVYFLFFGGGIGVIVIVRVRVTAGAPVLGLNFVVIRSVSLISRL
jgi:hypothetical protein